MFNNTESKSIWNNGKFVKWDDSLVHLMSHTLNYGTGAFEGVRAYKTNNGPAIFRLNDHTDRLLIQLKRLILIFHFLKKPSITSKKKFLRRMI